MTSSLAIVLVLASAALTWLGLADWLPSGAERFYLLLPPTALGLILLWSPCSRKSIARHARTAALILATAFLVSYAVACILVGTLALPAMLLAEILWAGYFLVSIGIVWAGIRWGVHAAFARLAARIPRGRLHSLFTDAAPVLVTVALITPYLMGVGFVHRFKVPLHSNPLHACQRSYQDVEFQTCDQLTIRGWFVPATQTSQRTLLVCHGLGGNREQFLGFLELADRLQANALFFDFRGHGASDGHTVSLGLREKDDVLAAVAYLRAQHAEAARELIGLGVSMGSGALVLAAAEIEEPLHGLILDSGMAWALDLTDNVLNLFPSLLRPWLSGPGIPLASLHAGCPLEDLRPSTASVGSASPSSSSTPWTTASFRPSRASTSIKMLALQRRSSSLPAPMPPSTTSSAASTSTASLPS